ncbi:hypothetical protein B0H15DRAFT_949214 [Mycena belliarum]|uniref:Uncharacterized protein n=1 Tax=Mycena belliarum TaxID=1033014 RepID=A0AAD6U3F2_9AGAR|nr:hypothetical protein B0H15DRAFT_949214 [Mycena belliae]
MPTRRSRSTLYARPPSSKSTLLQPGRSSYALLSPPTLSFRRCPDAAPTSADSTAVVHAHPPPNDPEALKTPRSGRKSKRCRRRHAHTREPKWARPLRRLTSPVAPAPGHCVQLARATVAYLPATLLRTPTRRLRPSLAPQPNERARARDAGHENDGIALRSSRLLCPRVAPNTPVWTSRTVRSTYPLPTYPLTQPHHVARTHTPTLAACRPRAARPAPPATPRLGLRTRLRVGMWRLRATREPRARRRDGPWWRSRHFAGVRLACTVKTPHAGARPVPVRRAASQRQRPPHRRSPPPCPCRARTPANLMCTRCTRHLVAEIPPSRPCAPDTQVAATSAGAALAQSAQRAERGRAPQRTRSVWRRQTQRRRAAQTRGRNEQGRITAVRCSRADVLRAASLCPSHPPLRSNPARAARLPTPTPPAFRSRPEESSRARSGSPPNARTRGTRTTTDPLQPTAHRPARACGRRRRIRLFGPPEHATYGVLSSTRCPPSHYLPTYLPTYPPPHHLTRPHPAASIIPHPLSHTASRPTHTTRAASQCCPRAVPCRARSPARDSAARCARAAPRREVTWRLRAPRSQGPPTARPATPACRVCGGNIPPTRPPARAVHLPTKYPPTDRPNPTPPRRISQVRGRAGRTLGRQSPLAESAAASSPPALASPPKPARRVCGGDPSPRLPMSRDGFSRQLARRDKTPARSSAPALAPRFRARQGRGVRAPSHPCPRPCRCRPTPCACALSGANPRALTRASTRIKRLRFPRRRGHETRTHLDGRLRRPRRCGHGTRARISTARSRAEGESERPSALHIENCGVARQKAVRMFRVTHQLGS